MMQRPSQDYRVATANQTTSLAELLERVLDKGIVIAGDITVSLAEVELLSIKVRLLVASIDKAREIGINWWQSDPALSTRARHLEDENRQLRERVERLEAHIAPSPSRVPPTPDYGRQGSLSQPTFTPTYGPPGNSVQMTTVPGYMRMGYGSSIPADPGAQVQQGPKIGS